MEQKELTYEQAMEKLEALVRRFEQGNIDIDQLGPGLKEAQRLLNYCKEKLLKVEKEVGEILQTENQ